MNAVIFYTVYIFRASVDRSPGAEGREGIVDEHSATIIVGVVQFLATFGEDQTISQIREKKSNLNFKKLQFRFSWWTRPAGASSS